MADREFGDARKDACDETLVIARSGSGAAFLAGSLLLVKSGYGRGPILLLRSTRG